jgi:hypothetical protein
LSIEGSTIPSESSAFFFSGFGFFETDDELSGFLPEAAVLAGIAPGSDVRKHKRKAVERKDIIFASDRDGKSGPNAEKR